MCEINKYSTICPFTGEILRHGWGGNKAERNKALRDKAEELQERDTHFFADLKFSLTEQAINSLKVTSDEIIYYKQLEANKNL